METQSNKQLTIAYEALQQKYNTRTGQQEEALRSKDVNITQLSGRLDLLERQAADDAQAWQEQFVLLERQFSSEEQISQYWKGQAVYWQSEASYLQDRRRYWHACCFNDDLHLPQVIQVTFLPLHNTRCCMCVVS